MNHPVESVNSAGARPVISGGIEFDGVSFSYPGSALTTLKDITFSIKPGELIGIVGKSGSGKSTISKLIQRLYIVRQGTVRFDGTDASDINLSYLRKNIGIVMQENFMFNASIKENIAISKPAIGMDAVINAAKVSGAYDFIQHLEHGFDTVLDEGGTNISGGQRQRLGIARAIITDPKILVLDEATSALDPDTEAHFMQNLSKISSSRTVLIISHRLSTLTRCDRIMVLDEGKIVGFADHQTLLRTSKIYKNLWDQQNY
jgi:ATP-binding cassette subfamily B protein